MKCRWTDWIFLMWFSCFGDQSWQQYSRIGKTSALNRIIIGRPKKNILPRFFIKKLCPEFFWWNYFFFPSFFMKKLYPKFFLIRHFDWITWRSLDTFDDLLFMIPFSSIPFCCWTAETKKCYKKSAEKCYIISSS